MALIQKIDDGITNQPLAFFGDCGSAVVPMVSFPEAGNGLPGVSRPIGLQVKTFVIGHFKSAVTSRLFAARRTLPPFFNQAMMISGWINTR